MAEAGTTAATAADSDRPAIHGHIAARIDRLPLTRVQWQLAILVEVTWGFIIVDTDGIGARLYPFVWRPNHLITVLQYSVIQALQVGLGVLLGAYIMSWIADRYGRRPAILVSTLLGGIFLWPFAHVFDFWPLVVLSVLSTLGVGGIVATHAVYLSELIAPNVRSHVLLASQGSTAVVGVGVTLLAFAWIPSHWQWFVWVSAAIQIVVLLPLLYWLLPEVVFTLAWIVVYFFPSPAVMATAVTVSRVCTGLFLFNLYNYTAVAFPTRVRSVAFAWTDGLGHLGAWAGVTLTGPLYVMGPNHLGWVLFIILPGAMLPALLIRIFGIRQAHAVLEQVSR